jgi:predicted secreted hydrolase
MTSRLGAGCWVLGAGAMALVAGGLWWRSGAPVAPASVAPITAALSGGDPTGFLTADRPRAFTFPADDGPHPGFRTEWWYWTANLVAADGRRFGMQFTIFRQQMTAQPAVRVAGLAADTVWMAHLAVTDGAGRRFHAAERFARGAAGLAGAKAEPFCVHVGGWSAAGPGDWRITAADAVWAVDLTVAPGKPVVLHGDGGRSVKSAETGSASYYYSRTRMPTTGTLTIDGTPVAVTGDAWFDREWSTSALARDQQGWDWFALHLDDGRDLMLYRLRRADGGADPASAGTLVAADGTATPIAWSDVRLEETSFWTSPRGGTYPAGWRLRVADLDLVIAPLVADQELPLAFRYWEGAVVVSGTVGGRGYIELVGYAR